MSGDSTETNAEVVQADRSRAPYLFVVLEGQRPVAGGARLCCEALDEIVIGRGETRGVEIAGRVATLTVPDRRMSTTHARIVRIAGGWELVDADSKNGCRVDDIDATRVALRDGAWIELGQTVLRFRTQLPHAAGLFVDAETRAPILGIVTLEPSFEDTLAALARLANSALSIAITGATGTGKELVARAIHEASARTGPFVAVNCAALSAGLVESQLFGHKKGAFSGALADHDGLIRSAHGGTLLLDEVADLPPQAQAALLRVLQEREVLPVGETRAVPVDVRFLSATHRDLTSLRPDLYARLAGHVATLPPIVARREDIGTIVATSLRKHRGAPATITIAAAVHLANAPWPHNAREIDHAIEAALALAGDVPLDVTHLPATEDDDDSTIRARLESLLVAHRGNISQIARDMGKARMQIQRWLKRWDLDPERFR